MEFKSIELFAGCGGLALGLEKAGFSHLGLVEIDKYACATLKKNRPNWQILEQDITKFDYKKLLEIFDINKKELDLLSGGYPCQSFSYAGKRLGLEDIRGTMFFYFAKFLKILEPKMFLCENVKGLISHNNGKTLQTMIDVFSDVGYKVQYKILNANDYGVAQKRQRIVIIGIRNDLNLNYEFPKPLEYKPVLKDALKNVPNSIGAKYTDERKKAFALVPPGGYWRDIDQEIAKSYMKSCYYMKGGRTGILRRISWDEPCLTLTCSPSQKQTDRCHPDEVRPFTTREYARIQSFPDNWEFVGGMANIYKQIGNAVPVNLAYEIGVSIKKALECGI